MTVKELISELQKFDNNKVVIIGDKKNGWANIQNLKNDGSQVSITEERYPIFSDN